MDDTDHCTGADTIEKHCTKQGILLFFISSFLNVPHRSRRDGGAFCVPVLNLLTTVF